MTISDLARPEILAMKPYSSARSEAPGEGILLNANESPWALIDDPAKAFREDAALNRYPQPQPAILIEKLAEFYGLPRDNLLVTRGSDEGIDLLLRVFCRAGQDAVLDCPPSFGMYRVAAQIQGARVINIPRDPETLALDQQSVLTAVESRQPPRLVFLTSPANPTGDVVDPGFLKRLLGRCAGQSIVVVDEAYVEFCESPSFAKRVPRHDNLVVLRTLSKAFGSASLRCGVTLAQAETIDLLRRVIAPYPLPGPIVSLALRLFDADVASRQRLMLREVRDNKQRLLDCLQGRVFIQKIWAGNANFVLVRVTDAPALVAHCASMGIAVRGFASDPSLRDCVRISVGSRKEIEALAAALDDYSEIGGKGGAANG